MLISTQLGVMKNRKDIQNFNHFRSILVQIFDFSSFFNWAGHNNHTNYERNEFLYFLNLCLCIRPKQHTYNKQKRTILPQVPFPIF